MPWTSTYWVTQQMASLQMLMAENHKESISFLIIESPEFPQILGYPWLCKHNLHIDCLSLLPASSPLQSLEFSDLSGVPEVYLDLSKTWAKALPPHCSYDCAIDLLSRKALLKGQLYSVSAPERKAMEEYIQEALTAGIIHQSSSPARAGFFFVKKKDKLLWLCIDY